MKNEHLMPGRVRVIVGKPNNVYPKGFDIAISEVISEYNLTEEQLKELGRLTATRRSGLAHATSGYMVYYRRSQIESMLNVRAVNTDVN